MSEGGWVRFDKWGAFTDTHEPYRRWKAWCDVPEVGVREGDFLFEREGYGWEGCRFQIRRGKEVVDELEDWQAAKLFFGELPVWPLEGHLLAEIKRLLEDSLPLGRDPFQNVVRAVADMMECMLKKAPESVPEEHLPTVNADVRRAMDALGWDRPVGWVARASIPGTPIVEGSVLALAHPDPGGLRPCRVTQIPREFYPAIADHSEALEFVGTDWRPDLSRSLRKSYAARKRARPESAPLHMYVPLVSGCIRPVVARNDAGAVFELLYQVSRGEG